MEVSVIINYTESLSGLDFGYVLLQSIDDEGTIEDEV